jgi:hypothetical protein
MGIVSLTKRQIGAGQWSKQSLKTDIKGLELYMTCLSSGPREVNYDANYKDDHILTD